MELNNIFDKVKMKLDGELKNLPKEAPIMFFPLRIETHFRHKFDKNSGVNQKQLCVRIIPDELMLDYHTERLTKQEIKDGRIFWLQWYIASCCEKYEYEAWKVLCEKYPVSRAAWICRCLKPKSIKDFAKGKKYFYRRPYGDMEVILSHCKSIVKTVSNIKFNKNTLQTDTGEYKFEYDLRQTIARLKELLFKLDCCLYTCEYIVDYLYEHVDGTISYLYDRLLYILSFYEENGSLYAHNSRMLELWDIDYTALLSFKKEVEAYREKISKNKISLNDLISLYLDDPKHIVFPKVGVREDNQWDLPVTNILPDRFYFIGEIEDGQGGVVDKDGKKKEQMLYAIGNPVKKNLQMAFSTKSINEKKDENDEKNEDNIAEKIRINENGDLEIEGGLDWMLDYDAAEKAGMAITVPIDEDICGFRYVYVLGINTDSLNNPDVLENLFIGHNYSTTGLELMKAGTPTNLVDDGPEFICMDKEEILKRRYNIEVKDVNDVRENPNVKDYDTYFMSSFLKMNFDSCWSRVINFDVSQRNNVNLAYNVLWHHFVETLPEDIRNGNKKVMSMLDFIGDFVCNYVNPLGNLPVLRVNNLPYGIFPITNFEVLKNKLKENAKTEKDRKVTELFCQLINLCNTWKKIRKGMVKSLTNIGAHTLESDFMEMMGQTPYSVSFTERNVIHSPFFPLHWPDIKESAYVQEMSDICYFGGQAVDDSYLPTNVEELVSLVEEKVHVNNDEAKLLVSSFYDIFTHRLDAWLSGILCYLYKGHEHTPCVGTYGWVFNLKENTRKEVSNKDEIIKSMKLEKASPSKIYETDGDDINHYIMCPTVQHAYAAAVLRSGYIKNRDKSDDGHNCVNLSSVRVRQAMKLLQALKQNMSLAVVLGAEMERNLHDDKEELDVYIYTLRQMYPLSINLTADNGDDRANDYSMQVINGEALLNSFLNQWNYNGSLYDWLEENKDSLDIVDVLELKERDVHRQAIFKIIERLADSFDALSDLLLSEGVFRLVMGDKASYVAISNYLATGEGNLPDPEIVNMPMEKVVVTYKTGVALPDPKTTTDKPLSVASPSLNAWVESQVGDMNKIIFAVEYVSDGGYEDNYFLSLGTLGITALEYVYLSSYESFKKYVEMKTRFALNVYDGNVNIIFNTDGYNIENSEEYIDVYKDQLRLSNIRTLLSKARTMTPSDWQCNIEESDYEKIMLDVQDLSDRYDSLLSKNNDIYDGLKTWLDNVKKQKILSDKQIFEAYNLVSKSVETGMINEMVDFTPAVFIDNVDPTVDLTKYNEIIEKQIVFVQGVDQIFKTLSNRIDEAKETVKQTTDDVTPEQYETAIKILTLSNFKVEKRYTLSGMEKLIDFSHVVKKKLSAYENLDEDIFDDWQDEISDVREGMRIWNQFQSVQTAYDIDMGDVSIIQTDENDVLKDDYWMGTEVPNEDTLSDSNTMVIYNSNAINVSNGKPLKFCGLVFDSWVEYIPYKKRTAGLAIHCDRPDNEAPQTVLLAIHPEVNILQNRKWTSEILLDVLGFTRLLAMNRAVEPDHLYTWPKNTGDETPTHLIYPLIGRTLISYGETRRRSSGGSYNGNMDGDIFDLMVGGDLLKDL